MNLNKELVKVPGPGQYDVDINPVKLTNPHWKFGKSKTHHSIKSSSDIGPGMYNTARNIGDTAPKYSITGKNFYDYRDNKNPGPGQYDEKNPTLRKAPTWKLGKSTREDYIKKVQRENFPGPGNYYSRPESAAPKFSFSKDSRIKSSKSESNPGPGQYKIPTTIFNVPEFVHGKWDSNYKFV